MSADWLSHHLNDADLVILDTTVPYGDDGPDGRLGFARWDAAHIPGSRHADLASALSDPDAGFSFAFPPEDRLVPALQALGIGEGARADAPSGRTLRDDHYGLPRPPPLRVEVGRPRIDAGNSTGC